MERQIIEIREAGEIYRLRNLVNYILNLVINSSRYFCTESQYSFVMKNIIMKVCIKILFFLVIITGSQFSSFAQKASKDSTGYPGDNFSLQGALEMFQKSKSPEEFEKIINTKDKNVNNLDLNKDGKTDYVKVIDKTEKKVHAFILQVPVSEKESQDIAVIELEKTGDTSAIIQIVGDKDIYGKEAIIEPVSGKKEVVSTSKWDYNVGGPSDEFLEDASTTVIVNVWYWPCVTFIYGPIYTPWISPWVWGYYPSWWTAWRPVSWYTWYPNCAVYNHSYVAVNTYRVSSAHYLYTPYRTGSATVSRQAAVAVGPNGAAVGTKTTVTGPAGRSATRVSGAAIGPNGAVRGTSIRRGRF